MSETADRMLDELRDRINEAVRIAADYGWYDGAHHKEWIIDQMLRALLGDAYAEVIGDDWPQGIAP